MTLSDDIKAEIQNEVGQALQQLTNDLSRRFRFRCKSDEDRREIRAEIARAIAESSGNCV